VTVFTLAARNLTRNKTRVILTLVGVAVAVMAFVLIRTVLWSWEQGKDAAAKDRIATRHKVTFVMQLPHRYIDDIRNNLVGKGIKQSTFMNWFGGKDPKDEKNFYAKIAVEDRTFLDVYDEVVLTPEAKQRWLEDPQGAIVGINLAKKLGVKEGGKVNVLGDIYPGMWEFHVSGIYTSKAKSFDESGLYFHWDYLNNTLPPGRKDQIGWIVSRVDDASKSAAMVTAVDKLFDDRDIQTLTQSERELNASFLGMFAALLSVFNIASMVILAILGLILGNTIAMGVRERTYEYGVLRALGFRPRHIGVFVMSEAVLIGLLGGVAGLVLALLIVSGAGPALVQNTGGMFPYFEIDAPSAAMAVAAAVAVALVAGAVPAYRASRLEVVTALRRVG
jgi:putative ABC transport system permease protein